MESTAEAGIAFHHDIGRLDDFELPQIMGSGAALFDFDGDGRLDLYLVNYRGEAALYRQGAAVRFDDVTGRAGLTRVEQGMGTAVADLDNDGFPDLLVTAYGSVGLWRNNGDGTFQEITAAAGLRLNGFATAACFCDYDRDGHLDLLVVNYVDYVPGQWCEDGTGRRDFCSPSAFAGTVDRLFRNRGTAGAGSLFEETTIDAGLASAPGKGLGAVCGDFTGDGWPDFYIANDLEANQLWVQRPGGTFDDLAALSGAAVNQFGEAEASMGVIAADLTNDGSPELFLTHLSGQTNTLYAATGGGFFTDRTRLSGLGPPSLPYTGFGVAAVDLNHDGHLDLLVANGRVKRGPARLELSDTFLQDYGEPNQLFLNDGTGRFREAAAEGGAFTQQVEVSRGLVVGDVDNDGAVDFLVTNCGGPARLFLNQGASGHWLSVRLVGRDANRDAVGAQVILMSAGAALHRWQSAMSGYLTSNDPRIHFGLGAEAQFAKIIVRWPDGVAEEFGGGGADRRLVLVQGDGSQVTRDQPEQLQP